MRTVRVTALATACGLALSLAAPAGAHPNVATAPAAVLPPDAGGSGWYTYHDDNLRTGWNAHERALTVASVSSSRFGMIRTLAGDGVVYAQPLYLPRLKVAGALHNVVLFATEEDSVYAYDADSGLGLWHRSLLRAGEKPVPSSSVGCSQIAPTIGVSSTPVVDPATGTLYVSFKVERGTSPTYHNYVGALDVSTGKDKLSPEEVAGSVPLSGGGTSTFEAHWQQQRPGLLLSHGRLYVGFGSSCDAQASFVHGWIFAYDPATLKPDGIFSSIGDPASYEMDSIWQGTFGLAAGENGDLFFATGNGSFDVNTGGRNYGDSVIRTGPDLRVKDYFAPYNELQISNADLDVGSAGVVLVPQRDTPGHALAVQGGKNGEYFLLDRTHLGEFTQGGPDNVLQEIPIPQNSEFGGPAYAGGLVYLVWSGAPISAYSIVLSGPKPQLQLASQTKGTYNGEGGPIPAISSDGTRSGTAVLWATTDPGPGGTIELDAYDATNLTHELFAGGVGTWNARAGAFLSPTVAGGHVFVPGAGNGVAEFGLH